MDLNEGLIQSQVFSLIFYLLISLVPFYYFSRKILGGQLAGITTGAPVTEATQCLTDIFTITNQENLPTICGINSGYHVYFGNICSVGLKIIYQVEKYSGRGGYFKRKEVVFPGQGE